MPAATRAGETFPYDLAFELGYGPEGGPRILLDRLGTDLREELGNRGCYRSIRWLEADAEAPDGLFLRLTIDHLEEEILYEVGVADRATSADPRARQRLRAVFTATLLFELVHLPENVPVRRDTIRVQESVVPIMTGHEDDYAREEARRRGVRELRLETAKKACKGTSNKLQKQIAAAIAGGS